MNSKPLVYLLFIISGLLYSQEKRTYYFDSDFKTQISKDSFLSPNKRLDRNGVRRHRLYLKKDTCIIAILHPGVSTGKLKTSQLDSLKVYLNKIANKNDALENHIVINYYSGNQPYKSFRRRTNWDIYDSDYLKKLKKIISFQQYYIYKDIENLKHQRKKKKHIHDTHEVIKYLFFPYQIPYGSFVIIKPDGRYACVYGEYGKQIVWDIAKEISESDNKEKN